MRKLFFYTAMVTAVALLSSCTGKEGPMGPTGPAGQPGTPGVALLHEYTGTLASDGDFEIEVPEILNRRADTFVEAYWSLSSSPDIWTLMSDGWQDAVASSRTCAVSWTFGKVYLFGMLTGDNYLIKVFQYQ